VFVDGLQYGMRHRVVRPVMFASLVSMSFMIFGFYSWQRYFLDLLGRDLVWVDGLIAALVSLSMIFGNWLVRPLSLVLGTRTGMLAGSVTVQAVTAALCGALGFLLPAHASFYAVVALYLVYGVALGAMAPRSIRCSPMSGASRVSRDGGTWRSGNRSARHGSTRAPRFSSACRCTGWRGAMTGRWTASSDGP
jgi:MFS family permease